MELVVLEFLVVLVILVGALFAFANTGRSQGRSARPNTQKISKQTAQKRTRPAHRSASKSGQSHQRTPPAFNEKSARHLPKERLLKGAAWVVDGDTIKIKNTQIRLFGVDAPELNHPYGKKAKWALHELCKGQEVSAEITDVDEYGRTVARCYLPDGRDLSEEMVRKGLALDWSKFSDGAYRHLETNDARKKLFLADARQKGRMHVWERFEARNKS
ncbi:thermonuclease family protein [Aestuariivita boseongensis]|uniref:thermonuclease family protein n=1 Tax=Aestuariivita boseongensis TaxID=1470562 RepID=UPI0009E37247|nr:thermonuclease family protein [Aestuariivita boseongensis]